MNIAEMKAVVKEIITKTDYVPCIIGAQGIGKSEAQRQIAKELSEETGQEWGFRVLNLASMEPTDLMGIPVADHTTGTSKFIPPAMIPWEENVKAGLYPERGILVLDELNRVQPMNRSAVLNLLNEKQVNTFKLPPGWKITVTINPNVEGFNVHELDLAEHSRLIELVVHPDEDVWLQYAYARAEGAGRDVPDFIALHKGRGVLFNLGRGENNQLITRPDITLNKTPDPRGWEKVMVILSRCSLPEHLLREVLSGIIGADLAASFMTWRRNKERRPVPAKAILESYEQVRKNIQEQIQNRHYDLLMATIIEVIAQLPNYLSGSQAKTHTKNFHAFMADLPEEHQVVVLRYVLQSEHKRVRQLVLEAGSVLSKLAARANLMNAELAAERSGS